MATATRLLTFEEFEQLPETPGKQELLEGELIELPPVKLRHNKSAERIFLRLHPALAAAQSRGEAGNLGQVHHEMGFKLGDNTWVVPDVSVTFNSQGENDYYEGAPAIAIEGISPGNTAEEVEFKVELYFKYGARQVWRVHPKARCVVIHIADGSHTVRDTLTTPFVPGFSMSVAEILG